MDLKNITALDAPMAAVFEHIERSSRVKPKPATRPVSEKDWEILKPLLDQANTAASCRMLRLGRENIFEMDMQGTSHLLGPYPLQAYTFKTSDGGEDVFFSLMPNVLEDDYGNSQHWLFGRYYGYPECCIKEFTNDFATGNVQRPNRHRAGGPHITCRTCFEKPIEVLMEEMVARRICTLPYTDTAGAPGDNHLPFLAALEEGKLFAKKEQPNG